MVRLLIFPLVAVIFPVMSAEVAYNSPVLETLKVRVPPPLAALWARIQYALESEAEVI